MTREFSARGRSAMLPFVVPLVPPIGPHEMHFISRQMERNTAPPSCPSNQNVLYTMPVMRVLRKTDCMLNSTFLLFIQNRWRGHQGV
jgi:hypothetical protein